MSDETYTPKVYRKQGGDELRVASGGKIILESGGLITDEVATAAGAGLSPDLWDDCPRLQMLIDPTQGHFVGDDFIDVAGTHFTTANNYVLAGANGTFTHLAADQNGVAVLTAPGTDNDECNVNYNSDIGIIKLDAAKNWWFEARVKVNQITTAQGVFVGLITDDITMGVDFHADDTMVMKVQDALGFQILAATDIAAVWQSMMILTGGARVAIDATLLTAGTGWVKLGMKSVLGAVTFYVNGVAESTGTTSAATNFPLDQYVVPAFATKCGSAAANTLSIDWWYAAQLR